MTIIYDTIIVGSGIAGLYAAHKLYKKYPKRKILILEKMKHKYIGGRTGNEEFYGVEVVTGAGVGRKNKDVLLMKLVKEFKIPYTDFIVENQFASTVKNPVDIGKMMSFLKKKYKEEKQYGPVNTTFRDFALPIFGPELYHDFLESNVYTDFENADLHETLCCYEINDNESGWTGFHISWKLLVERISKKLTIKFSQDVVAISKSDDGKFVLDTEEGNQYICNQVIVATTIASVRKLFHSHSYPIYDQIEGQTFLRMYGKFAKSSVDIMKQYVQINTIVGGPVHRIIPMDKEKGVYMIAYTDNDGARFFKNNLKNTQENREFWAREVEAMLGIQAGVLKLLALRDFYWPIGTHYYKPLSGPYKNRDEFIKQAQHPLPGVVVVGEMVSRRQGWVEGALESVEAVASFL